MSSRVNPTWIGLFVLGALALALAAVTIFGSGGLFRERVRNVLYFSGSVKGLNVGSPVMFRGVTIGEVKEIRVICDTRDLTFRIPVLIEIDMGMISAAQQEEKLETALTRHGADDFLQLLVEHGLRAQLQMQSFVTGNLFVQLDFYPDTPLEMAGDKDLYQESREIQEIPTVLSSFEEVTRTLEQIPLDQVVQKTMATLEGIERLVNDPALSDSISSLDEALMAIRELAAGVDARMGQLVSSVDGTMQEVRGLARSLDAQVAPVSAGLLEATTAATRAFDDTGQALEQIEGTLAAGSPERRELRRALQEMAEAARAVRVLAEALEMQPDMLLKGRSRATPAEPVEVRP